MFKFNIAGGQRLLVTIPEDTHSDTVILKLEEARALFHKLMMEKEVSADEASTAEVLDKIEECVHRKQDLLAEGVPRNGRYISLLYKSGAHSELGTSPKGIDQNAAISRSVRPQLVRKVCSTLPTVDDRPPYRPFGCLPRLRVGSSRSKKK